MKISALIPARYNSKRFPGKMMEKLGNKTVIQQTYESVIGSNLFDEVFVITDSMLIFNDLKKNNLNVLYSKTNHECGTDRIAEFVNKFDSDIIFNVQGDEPFIDKKGLKALINIFKNDSKEEVKIASLMTPISDKNEISNPNVVKVVVDNNDFAIYFSRHSIPYNLEKNTYNYLKHIGVYALRKDLLKRFSTQGKTNLESIEKIEAIRFIEMGYKIKMVITDRFSIGIDTKDDLKKANQIIKSNQYD
tara:strand:+ start:78 stop:818 length:741 start_codon:yes stop_codon:yes gene_type:complete